MLLRLKLHALIAWNTLTQGSIIERIELKQRLSTISFEQAANNLQKVEGLYQDQAEQFTQQADDLREKVISLREQSKDAEQHASKLEAKLIKIQDFLI